MTNFKHILSTLAAAAVIVIGCEKTVAPIDSYGVTVDFKGGSTKNLTGNVALNAKDSIILDFTVASSSEDMAVIEIQKNGAKIDTFNVSGADKRNFSGVKRYQSDSIAGDYTYRVFARNKKGVYIGDGGKSIKVTINPDFHFWSFKTMAVPDSVAKTNKSFFVSTTGDGWQRNKREFVNDCYNQILVGGDQRESLAQAQSDCGWDSSIHGSWAVNQNSIRDEAGGKCSGSSGTPCS